MDKARTTYQLFIVTLIMGMAFAACNQNGEMVTIAGVTSEVTDRGVRLRISSDKTIYQPGEAVNITVTVENLTNAAIEFTLWNIGDPAIYVYLENTPYSTGEALYEKDREVKAVKPAVTSDVLQSGRSISRQVVWDQRLNTYPDSIQAPTGSYSIRCEFFVGPYSSGNEPIELSAHVEVRIQGSWQIIKPEEAVKIAQTVPEVAGWHEEHSGDNLVKYEDGQYYLYFFSEWQKVTPNFTADGMTLEEIKQDYEPDHNVLMVSNTWEVHFFTKLGPTPNEIIVKIEPTTGKVLSYEFGK